MKKLLYACLITMALSGCASTDTAASCKSNFDTTTTYTGNADECKCEAKGVIGDYNNQINVQGIEIDYSADNAMQAKSCQSAILANDKGIHIDMIEQDGEHIYGYHYPMSKYTWGS